MSTNFVRKLGLPLVPIKACYVKLLNNESSVNNHCMLKVLVDIEGVNIVADFKVWSGVWYDTISGMTWLCQVDTYIACEEDAVYEKLSDGISFFIRGKRSLLKVLMFSHSQMKSSIKKCEEISFVYVIEL